MSRLKKTGGALTALGLLVAAFVGGWEGKRNVAYQDVVGIWTVCYGETRGVKAGDRYTDDECLTMLGDGVAEFEVGMRACLSSPDTIPPKPYAMFVSLSYNIGVRAFCRSTVASRANAGDIRGACNAIRAFNKGGKPLRVIKGLDNRRAAEQRMCLEGV